jgi:hypothetical protein
MLAWLALWPMIFDPPGDMGFQNEIRRVKSDETGQNRAYTNY